MEGMNPLLHLILQVRLSLERGEPLRTSLRSYLRQYKTDMTSGLSEWLLATEQGRAVSLQLPGWESSYRQAFHRILIKGMRGEPIVAALALMENEIFELCLDELDHKAAILPLQCLAPLLLLQFPALLALVLGPFLSQFLSLL